MNDIKIMKKVNYLQHRKDLKEAEKTISVVNAQLDGAMGLENSNITTSIRVSHSPQKVNQDDAICYLNTLMMCEVMMDSIEAVKNTGFYKHQLKLAVGRLEKEIEKIVKDDLADIWGVDDTAMYHLMDEMKVLLKRLAISRPETWNIVNELIDSYNENPTEFLKRNNLEILES